MPKGATKAQVKAQLRACEEMVDKGTLLSVKEVPKFSEAAADWLNYKRAKIRETTWEVYEGHVRNHFDALVRFHDLRHTNASLRLENGKNIKYIQTHLGHANPTVTLNVYAHLMNPTNQEAACRLENAVFGAVWHHLAPKIKRGYGLSP